MNPSSLTLFSILRTLLITSLVALTACNYNRLKEDPATTNSSFALRTLGVLDFKAVQTNILGPRCYGCHTPETGNKGNSNLASYNLVRAQLARVSYRTLETQDMPPGRPLSKDEMLALTEWLDAGAPEIVNAESASVDRSLEKGPTNFAKVRDSIFAARCLSCHQPRFDSQGTVVVKPEADLDLSDYQQTKTAAERIFNVLFVTGSQPPSPLPTLSPRERRVLLKWFELGMPQ